MATPLGEPVVDAQIEAMHGGDPAVLAASDASGTFTLRGLAPQEYVIRVTRNGYFKRNQDVTVAGDMRVDLMKARNRVSVAGTVSDASPCSARIDDARVEIVDGPDAGKWTNSGSSGYHIDDVSWGTFRVRASKSGYGSFETSLRVPPPIPVDGTSTRTNIELQSVVPQFSMVGTLRDRTRETGGQVNDALVEIIDGPNRGRSTTSANGAYRFENLISGAAPLRISHPAYMPYVESGARVCSDNARFDIKLTPN
jgi:hypothetical protein